MRRKSRQETSRRGRVFGRREMKGLSHDRTARSTGSKRKLSLPLLATLGLILGYLLLHPYLSSAPESRLISPSSTPQHPEPLETWATLSALLAQGIQDLPGAPCIHTPLSEDRVVTVRSCLDPAYQSWVEERMRRSMALAGAAVVMHPASGRILALSVFNADPERPLAFFWKAYPAASIFKIVTAAAALDQKLLSPDSVLEYTGRKHTLYRRQLEQKSGPWSHRVTLEESFARSINPVFGKIGIHHLGRQALEAYGSAFFFSQPFPCELPVQTSTLHVPADALGLADVASGFNRETLLSPVQAAWLASVLAADGSAPAPWLVESFRPDPVSDTPALDHQQAPIRVLPARSARQMQRLMEATIRYGTCRKSFSRRNRYPYTRPLTFGGKTGNINDGQGEVKYDWFVGYARSPDREDALAVSVLMFHGETLGHRANVMAFDLLRAYYRHRPPHATSRRGSS